MKKLLAVILAAIMLLTFAACGDKKSETDADAPVTFELLLEKGEDMKNTYSLIACNPDSIF